MSNPADPESGGAGRTGGDDDAVTEVIDIGDDMKQQSGEQDAGEERRFTAPGFDAGSTQIIDRVPDAPTEFITSPTGTLAAEPRAGTLAAEPRAGTLAAGPRTAPQAIPARAAGRKRRWLTPAIMIVLALVVAAAIGTVLLKRSSAARASQQDQVRTTIQTFDNAIRQGDLSTLRSITCGRTRDSYVNYDDQSWADTYSRVLAAGQYPVVASIDEVVVNGDHAEANVTSYMAFDPDVRSTRSFDLQFRDDQWKICQSS